MSRSRKRHPFTQQSTAASDKPHKQHSARATRRAVHVKLQQGHEGPWPLPYERANPYKADKDGKHWFDPEEAPKLLRK